MEAVADAQDAVQGGRPLQRRAQAVREQPGEPVQLDLRGVGGVAVQRGVGAGADEQAQLGQVGAFVPGRGGEAFGYGHAGGRR